MLIHTPALMALGWCIEERLWTALAFVLTSQASLAKASSGKVLAKTFSAPLWPQASSGSVGLLIPKPSLVDTLPAPVVTR